MPDVSRLAQVRARLDLPVARRAAGLLEGRHRSVYKGHGQDFDDLHLYSPGEDVGDIDWKSSARAGIPVVRRFVSESNLNLVLVVDTGRTMAATASGGEPKHAVAAFCCALVAYLARDRGDRVALVAGDAERLEQLPPRASTQDLETMLRTLERMWAAPGDPADPTALPADDLARPLDRALHAFTRRSLMVVVTDEAHPAPEHEPLLRRLRVRHEVLALQVADLAPAGPAVYEDVDGALFLPPYLTARPEIARAAAQAATRRRAEVAAALRRRQIESTVVGSTDDVVRRFVELLGRQRRAGR